jgi:hypothetical protein
VHLQPRTFWITPDKCDWASSGETLPSQVSQTNVLIQAVSRVKRTRKARTQTRAKRIYRKACGRSGPGCGVGERVMWQVKTGRCRTPAASQPKAVGPVHWLPEGAVSDLTYSLRQLCKPWCSEDEVTKHHETQKHNIMHTNGGYILSTTSSTSTSTLPLKLPPS